MGASKDLDITLHPRSTTEDELLGQVREYDEIVKQRCNLFLWKMNDRLFDLRRAVTAFEFLVETNSEAATFAGKVLRDELNAYATRLQNLARSLDPAETEPEEPSGFPV